MLMDWYAGFFSRHRGLVALFVVGLTMLSGWGHLGGSIPRTFERLWPASGSDADAVAADSDPAETNSVPAAAAEEPDEDRSIDAMLVFQCEDFFRPDRMAAMRKVVKRLESLDHVRSVIWIDRVPVLNMFGVPEPLIPPDGSSSARFSESRSRVVEHPLAVGQLVSEDAKTLVMLLTFDWLYVADDADCSSGLVDVANEVLAGEEIEGIEVSITGDIPLFIAQELALQRNHRKFQIIGYLLAMFVSIVLFRGLSAVLIVALAPAAGIFWTLGLMEVFDFTMNRLTDVILPVLVSMVGLTDGVHLMIHIRKARHQGLAPVAAASDTIRRVGMACALTSLTTAIGFGSLNLTHAPFIRSFGSNCATGVMISFLAVVTVVPLLSSTWLGRRIDEGTDRDLVSRNLMGTDRFIRWIIDRPRQVTLFAVLLTTLLIAVALTLRPDNRIKHSLPSDSETYAALEICDRQIGGIDTARVVVHWSPEVGSRDTEIYRVVRKVQSELEAEPFLQYPVSIQSLLETFPEQHGDLANRMSFLGLLPPPLMALFFDEPNRETFVTFRLQDLGIARYEPVFRRLDQKFETIMREHPRFTVTLAGDPVVRSRDLYRVVTDLALSLGAATIVILVVLAIAYRSWRLGLVSLIPNLFPLAATGTVLVLMGGSLDFASVCSFTVCLGIAVDDTIHFLTRYRQLRTAGLDVRESVLQTYLSVGTALITTTVILVLGFSTALTSDLRDHRMFAGMACATIAAALVGDLIFLPALLVCFPEQKRNSAG